jgi:hypothetical protein
MEAKAADKKETEMGKKAEEMVGWCELSPVLKAPGLSAWSQLLKPKYEASASKILLISNCAPAKWALIWTTRRWGARS